MALKALVKKEEYDKLPDAIKSEYEDQGDGTFTLAVDEKDYKDRIKEFRNTNLAMAKERDKLTKDMERFKDIDPEQYQAALEARKKLDEIETQNLAKAGNIDEVLAKRTEAMRVDYEKKLKAITDARDAETARANKYQGTVRTQKIHGTIRDAVAKVGNLRAGAMQDVLNRAERVFQLDDNDEIIAPDKFDAKGEPLTPETWAKGLLTDNAYLFEASQGGGAQGGTKSNRQQGNQQKTLRNPDQKTFGQNLEAIAAGKMEVVNDGAE